MIEALINIWEGVLAILTLLAFAGLLEVINFLKKSFLNWVESLHVTPR